MDKQLASHAYLYTYTHAHAHGDVPAQTGVARSTSQQSRLLCTHVVTHQTYTHAHAYGDVPMQTGAARSTSQQLRLLCTHVVTQTYTHAHAYRCRSLCESGVSTSKVLCVLLFVYR